MFDLCCSKPLNYLQSIYHLFSLTETCSKSIRVICSYCQWTLFRVNNFTLNVLLDIYTDQCNVFDAWAAPQTRTRTQGEVLGGQGRGSPSGPGWAVAPASPWAIFLLLTWPASPSQLLTGRDLRWESISTSDGWVAFPAGNWGLKMNAQLPFSSSGSPNFFLRGSTCCHFQRWHQA